MVKVKAFMKSRKNNLKLGRQKLDFAKAEKVLST